MYALFQMTKLNKIRKFVIVGDEKSRHFPLIPILNQFNFSFEIKRSIQRNNFPSHGTKHMWPHKNESKWSGEKKE